DYVQAAKKEEKKNKAIKKLSKKKEMARHSALLCRMLHDYPARKWKIELDGKDISGRYILWEAMNIHSVGPALYLAPRAGTRDGRFDFACARPADSALLAKHFEARVDGKKSNSPLPARKFRKLRVVWKGPALHLDEAEAEAGVRNGAVTAKIEIPFVVGGVHVVSAHVFLQDI